MTVKGIYFVGAYICKIYSYLCGMYINSDFSRLEINLDGCLANYRYFRSKLQDRTKLLVLVKANAYGHGAVEFANLMEDAGADYLAVAYPVEGIELRLSLIHI